jgi:peptide-methionine (R)-S-oxide reductase
MFHEAMGKTGAFAGTLALVLAACSPDAPEVRSGDISMKARPKVECTDCDAVPAVPESALPASEEEWKKKLTPEEFYILRQKGTERPYTGKWLKHKEDGIYTCAGCGQPLYDSKTKYDSCGWPSFWDALPGAVDKHPDLEATCSRCKGHLGHIFDDGPPPTGKRH